MTTTARTDLDWAKWMHRYDAQQEIYVPARERRFALMIDLVEALVPAGPRSSTWVRVPERPAPGWWPGSRP